MESRAGFHDHHSHVSLYAAMLGVPDLAPLGPEDAWTLLRGQPRGRLSIVKGWRSDRLELSRQSTRDLPPLLIVNWSLHGHILTPAALPLAAGLWPDLAAHDDDPEWAERHLPELFAFYARLAGLDAGKIDAFMGSLAGMGIASAEDMSTTGSGALSAIAASAWAGRVKSWAAPAIWNGLGEAERREVYGFKLFLDGSLGARSAALDRPFLGGEEGRLLYADEELLSGIRALAPYGKALAIHAIGHRAIEQALCALEAAEGQRAAFREVRLEHAQFITRGQALRARDLGLVLSMQPNFNSDSVDYADRLPVELLESNDPFRMLIDEAGFVPGRNLVFGSDGMPHGLEYALRHCLEPRYPGQGLSRAELEAGYRDSDA